VWRRRARASRATGSPRCLFTGLSRLPPCALRAPVYPVCVPCVSRLPPVSFLPVHWWVGMLVRFVCVIRVSVCVRALPGVFLPVHGHGRSFYRLSASHARLFGACGCVSGREGPETNERTKDSDDLARL